MKEIGEQYPKDDRTDPSGFLKRARRHQSEFRATNLDLSYDTYGNYLTKEDGEKGKNFYEGFEIFEAVRNRYKNYNKSLYSNMLRSEHIPFNFFVPLDKDRDYCKMVFREILKEDIVSIDRIKIEYAPKPKEKHLNDGTSFDAYIEYTDLDKSKGIIGIEVKYTEREYKLPLNSKEKDDINEPKSRYYQVTERSDLYHPNSLDDLRSNDFRQVWRNHLLGESILQKDPNKFKCFTSLTLFPAGNSHFVKISKAYINLLKSKDGKFMPLTYEDFFETLKKHCPNNDFRLWIDYLETRYIVRDGYL